jgi:hypothetical protein
VSDTSPGEDLDRDMLLEQLRVARNRLAIAEAELAETTAAMAEIAGGRFMVKSHRRPDGTTVQALSMGWHLVDDENEVVCLLGVNVPLARVAIDRATAELLFAECRRQPEAEGPSADATAEPAG